MNMPTSYIVSTEKYINNFCKPVIMPKTKKDKIIKLLRQGMSVTEISEELGVSKSYVSKVKRAYERGGFLSEGELEAAIFERLDKGKTPVDIVKELKVPSKTVKEVYERYLDLRELPPVTVFDFVEEMEENINMLEKQVRVGMDSMRKDVTKALEGSIKKILKRTQELVEKEKKERESRDNLLMGIYLNLLVFVGHFMIQELVERILTSSVFKAGRIEDIPDYKIFKEWFDMMTNLSKVYKSTQTVHGYLMTLLIEQIETYRDYFKQQGDVKATKYLDQILKALSNQ